MINERSKRASDWLYHPVLHTFLLPAVQMLFGTVYATRFTHFQLVPFLVAYIFLFINKLLENHLTKSVSSSAHFFPKLNLVLEAGNLLCLMYFLANFSVLGLVLPLAYTLVIHFQYIFLAYDMGVAALVILALFKGMAAQGIVFYLFLGFLPLSLLRWAFPFIFLAFLLNAGRWEKMLTEEEPAVKKQLPDSFSFIVTHAKRRVLLTLGLSLFTGISILWTHAGWLSLFLLASVPLLHSYTSRSLSIQNKKLQLFSAAFVLLYTTIWLIRYIPR